MPPLGLYWVKGLGQGGSCYGHMKVPDPKHMYTKHKHYTLYSSQVAHIVGPDHLILWQKIQYIANLTIRLLIKVQLNQWNIHTILSTIKYLGKLNQI